MAGCVAAADIALLMLFGLADNACACDPGVVFGHGHSTSEQGSNFPQGANATWMATTVTFLQMVPSTGMDVFLSTTVNTGCAGGCESNGAHSHCCLCTGVAKMI